MENNIAKFDSKLSENDFKKLDNIVDEITEENNKKYNKKNVTPRESSKLESTPN